MIVQINCYGAENQIMHLLELLNYESLLRISYLLEMYCRPLILSFTFYSHKIQTLSIWEELLLLPIISRRQRQIPVAFHHKSIYVAIILEALHQLRKYSTETLHLHIKSMD